MTSNAKAANRKSAVSLATVAERAGVSKMTASRVLRGADGYSNETRDKVLKVSRELGYVPNKLAQAFGSDKANTLIGIAMPTLSRDLYSQVLEGIEGKLASVGYQPIIGTVGYDDQAELQWLNSVLPWRPAGLILTARQRSRTNRDLLKSLQIPIVEIWDMTATPLDLSVGLNHFDAGFEMGGYLARHYSGQFGYVGAEIDKTRLGAGRFAGFQEALKEARGTDKGVLQTHFLKDRSSFYAGYYGAEQILSSHPQTRVLYFLDDNMAVGGLMLCQAKGIKVPGDIAIAGFGGMDIASVLPQQLTTTIAFRLRIGKLAAESLIKRITADTVNPIRDVGFELVRGETA